MRRTMKRIIPLFAIALMLTACITELDWTGISYPCSNNKPCADGFSCQAGVCVKDGTKPPPPPTKTVKPAFLFVGPVGDFGWTWAHEEGRKYLEKIGYETTFAGPVSPKDAPAAMDEFIKKGFNLIIGTSHDFLVPMLAQASKNDKVDFLTCSGFQTGSNIGSYFGRIYQAEWLSGMIAGAMTKTNKVGIIATVPIPELIRHINAFATGIQSTNPKAVLVVKWVGNWFDPKKEPILTQELLDANVDIIHSHTDTSIPLEMIENKKGQPLKTKDGDDVYTIGLNSINACEFGPRTCLTAAYWNWGPILERIINQVKEGKWNPKNTVWEQMKTDKKNSSFHLTPFNKLIPGTVRVQVESLFSKLSKEGQEGQQMPFQAPLKDNTGKTRLASGKFLSDQDLLNMCWYVDGVVDGDLKPAVVPSGCKGDR